LAPEYDLDTSVAVIGIACVFPGADNIDDFWSVLAEGRETITFFSEQELRAAGVTERKLADPHYVRARGIIDNIEYFDREFFGLDRLRAEILDPQQRKFFELAWQALEAAGYDSGQYDGRIGLYAGQAFNTYLLNNLRHAKASHINRLHSLELLLLTDKDFLTTHAAHLLGLTGPAVTVQTACSTSLVCIHMASQSLLARDCDIALAGAATIYAPQTKGYVYEPNSIISSDGHVRSFDEAGEGTVYSSGMGIVVLKRLADAVADRDTIHAVIRGTAVNNDGGRKGLFKAPSEEGIAEAAATALAVSGVDVGRIHMLEANGSGTPNGDAIEIHALTAAYREFTGDAGFCRVSSVKSNIGHLNVAAGMAAFIKAVLSVKHGQIPPAVNFRTPNPRIRFEGSPFRVATELSPWPEHDGSRLAAVNSYGVGGTNAHAVIQQAPAVDIADRPRHDSHVLPLSARTEAAFERMRARLADFLADGAGGLDLADVCYTMQVGRRPMAVRAAVVCQDAAEAAVLLREAEPVTVDATPRTVLWRLVPGRTSGQDLLEMARTEPSVAVGFEACRQALKDSGHPVDLLDALGSDPEGSALSDAVASWIGLQAAAALCGRPQARHIAATELLTSALAAAFTGERPLGEVLSNAISGRMDASGEQPEGRAGGDAVGLTVAGLRLTVAEPSGTARPVQSTREHGWVRAAADLYRAGAAVNFAALHTGHPRRRVPLPTYSFEPVRCWVEFVTQAEEHVYDAAN
jgi:acyl transferase domain-containing protein